LYKPDFNFNLFYLLLSKDVLKHLVQVAPDVLLNKSVGYLSDSFINEFHSKTHSFTGENSLFTYFFDDTRSFVVKSLFITSYMLAEDDLPNGGLRLLEVDNVLRVPAYTHLHFLITSSDVIHS
jgi:heme/copper-type cytochrome/quinol oxidase subunit 2